MENKFNELFQLDVNDKIEKRKDGNTELSYLSWAWAWAKFKKAYPHAEYKIRKFLQSKHSDCATVEQLYPYMYDEQTGYMVNTEITAGGITYEMWLPVMNGANKAMKNKPYTYKTKYGEKSVEAATMFDINKTIMRCLVKNMAMFGLGLYIYAGEDLPEQEEPQIKNIEEFAQKDAIADEIQECKTEAQLKAIYKKNKSLITGDKILLDLITKRADEIKKVA